MLYSIIDRESKAYLFCGINSDSLSKLRDAIIRYVGLDAHQDDLSMLDKITLEELTKVYDFKIQKHTELLKNIPILGTSCY